MREGRVAIVSDYVGGEGAASGGAGHAALDSARALRGAGVDVRLVTGFGAAPSGERVRALGGTDLRTGGLLDAARAIYNPVARRALAGALADMDPATTIVILHQWTRYLSPAALGLLDCFNTMIYMHDYFWVCPNGAYYDFRRSRPCKRRPMGSDCLTVDCDRRGRAHKLGRLARQAARILTVRAKPERRLFLHLSEGARRTAEPLLPGERHAILHNPIALPMAPPAPPPPPRHDFGYFGRMESEKGVDLLISAAARLGLDGLLVGDGALDPPSLDTASLTWRSWAPRAEMAALMRACAVVVLPSRWHETWGLIVPEAMAAGVRVLVSARAGSSVLVARFGGGAIFDPGLPGDLEIRLAALLRSPPERALDWQGLRAALAPETHARDIVALAARHFDVALTPPMVSAATASIPKVPRPAPVPPPPS